jgi:hypothetical protein
VPRAPRCVTACVPFCDICEVYADICAKLYVSGGLTGRLEAVCAAQTARGSSYRSVYCHESRGARLCYLWCHRRTMGAPAPGSQLRELRAGSSLKDMMHGISFDARVPARHARVELTRIKTVSDSCF